MTSQHLQKYFNEYKKYHHNKVNLAIHKIAVPLIFFHIIAMLSWVKVGTLAGVTISLAEITICAVAVFYFYLDWFLALLMLFFSIICLVIANITPVWLVCLIAVFTWIIQFIGHYKWEKKSPAFFKNLIQLLIGPLFFLSKFCGRHL